MKLVKILITMDGVPCWVFHDYSGRTLVNDCDIGFASTEEFKKLANDPYVLREYELGSPLFNDAMDYALKLVHDSEGKAVWQLENAKGKRYNG